MGLKDKFKTMNKNLIALLLFFVFWFSFLAITGTLNSGYHFRDDHEIVKINKIIEENGFVNTLKTYIKSDFKIRLRSFYWFYRVVLVQILGKNFFLWSLHHAILASLTSYLLFLFIRIQGHTYLNSLLFPFLILIGSQTAIWWRLGPAETVGFSCLSAALFFLANSVFRNKYYQLFISIAFLILATLTKESFILFIPAFVFIFLWFKHKSNTELPIYRIIWGNLVVIIVMGLIPILELYIIRYYIGTNNGYAGVDSSFETKYFINYIINYLKQSPYFYIIIFGFILFLINLKNRKDHFLTLMLRKPFLFNIVILILIIFPQFILYFKSGIDERYLLPFVFGFAFFIYFILNEFKVINKKGFLFRRAYVLSIIIGLVSFFGCDAYPNAKDFARDGKATNSFMISIYKYSRSNDSVLVVLNTYANYEVANSLYLYLTIEKNVSNIYFYPLVTKSDDEFEKLLTHYFLRDFNNVLVNDISNNFSCIAVLPFSGNSEVKSRLDKNRFYQRENFDDLTLYARKLNYNSPGSEN